MKRLLRMSIPMFFLTFFSCDSMVQPIVESQEKNVEYISVGIEQILEENVNSRMLPTVSSGSISGYLWQENDTLGIFPSVGGQVEFPIAAEDAGKASASFSGGGWAFRAGSEYRYSAYYPFNFYNRNAEAVPLSYLGQVQNGNDNIEHLRDFLFFACPPAQVKNGALSLVMTNVGSIQKLTLTMPVAKSWSMVSVCTDAEVFPVKRTLNLKDVLLSQTDVLYSDRVTVNLKNVRTTAANQEIIVWIAFPYVEENSHPLKVLVRDSEGFTYTANVTKNDGSQAYVYFPKHTWQRRIASPKPQEGMNSGISGWEDSGEDYGGSVN